MARHRLRTSIRTLGAAAALLAAISLGALSAPAAGPGAWTRVSDPNGTNQDEVAGTTRIWRLTGEGSRANPLDVLVHVDARGTTATWHTQVLPGLLASARVRGGGVTVSVNEAGDPVAGARVTAGGRAATTDRAGRASLRLPAGSHRLRVTKPGYEPVEMRASVP